MLNDSIKSLKGVGAEREKAFNRLGIFTIYDLLMHYPRTYQDRSVTKNISNLTDGETVCVRAYPINSLTNTRLRGGRSVQHLMVSDGTGRMSISWFNQRFLAGRFALTTEYVFYGKVMLKGGRTEMSSPTFEEAENGKFTGKIVPIYSLTDGLTQKILQSAIQMCVDDADSLPESLPLEILEKYKLCGINNAVRAIHLPKSFEEFDYARRRLVFEELLMLQLSIRSIKKRKSEIKGTPYHSFDMLDGFIKSLPYDLTGAQKRAIDEIRHDMASSVPMSRLVQGDVGSGKTIVAAAAMLMAVENGYQAAMMAPTEILAEQHFNTLSELFDDVILLTGSMNAKAKRNACERIAEGKAKIIVGTHALIQDNVEFFALGLVVTDEQHRFGVEQRKKLEGKGETPNVLIMSATPIPRTLAIILYGDLDISVIDEMPPGRKTVKTYAVNESYRERINSFMLKAVNEGHQVYIVCPLVEENEENDLSSVIEFSKKLQKSVFDGFRVEFMHGGLKGSIKEQIMRDFAGGEIDVLVSTTVIEVGVNVPNASLMVIENAERFGLSQLHQLRGRVGRGSDQSYCVLFVQSNNEITRERIKTMTETNDGFEIAEKDLLLRGPGDFFGTKQHGLPEMRIANLYDDKEILKESKQAADFLIKGKLADKLIANAKRFNTL